MNKNKKPYIFVVGNEKGGAGKTTCSMHLIIGLIDKGYKVASIDTDSRQHSLTTYINNREQYNKANPDHMVDIPIHYHIKDEKFDSSEEKLSNEQRVFNDILSNIEDDVDYIVIDTPGSHTNLSRIAHSYADTVITPINDSFVDLDVMAKIDGSNMEVSSPSIYSQMIWEQKMEKLSRDNSSINWVVLRNRLHVLDSNNKRLVNEMLKKISKRIAFKIIPGFSERVIFRELFPQGLTLLDLKKANFNKVFNLSHVAARQEIRSLLDNLGV